jgi:cytochrome c
MEDKMKKLFAIFVVCLFVASVAYAQDAGTAKDAQALVKKAVSYYKEVGKDKAIAEIGNLKGTLTNKDLYVFVYDLNGNLVMHPHTKALIGKNSLAYKDPDGKLFNKEIIDKAKASGSGWVDFKYFHVQTKKVVPKTAYLEKVDNLVFVSSAVK